jgi:hypothetical protein
MPFKLKDPATIMLALCLTLLSGCNSKPDIKWIGSPICTESGTVSTDDLIVIPKAELGLRSDGVVVWRVCKVRYDEPMTMPMPTWIGGMSNATGNYKIQY